MVPAKVVEEVRVRHLRTRARGVGQNGRDRRGEREPRRGRGLRARGRDRARAREEQREEYPSEAPPGGRGEAAHRRAGGSPRVSWAGGKSLGAIDERRRESRKRANARGRQSGTRASGERKRTASGGARMEVRAGRSSRKHVSSRCKTCCLKKNL